MNKVRVKCTELMTRKNYTLYIKLLIMLHIDKVITMYTKLNEQC